jgi:alpha-2-macroglobulin
VSKYHFLINSFLFCVIFSFAVQLLVADDLPPLPPHVINIQPYPGAEVSINEPLVITFDQPMNMSGIIFEFEPALTGTLTWIDSQRVAFVPQRGQWDIDQSYALTIAGAAANGLAFEAPFATSIQTQRSLIVTSISPKADEKSVSTNATITVTFDRPIVPLMSTEQQANLPSPLSFDPTITGMGEWVSSSVYRFTPQDQMLANGTDYVVTVNPDLIALDGAPLDQLHTWSFRTVAPSVQAVAWVENSLTSGIRVTFSHPMDHLAAERAFSFADAVYNMPIEGTFQWEERDKTSFMTFQPSEPLQAGTNYRVRIEASAYSRLGDAPMSDPYERVLSSVNRPTVVSEPQKELLLWEDKYQFITIEYNNRMEIASFEGLYFVTPEPEGEIALNIYEGNTMGIGFTQEIGKTYTITILPGARDEYGSTVEEPYSFSYHVRKRTPDDGGSLDFLINSNFLELGAYQENPMLGVLATGTPEITLDFYAIELPMLTELGYRWQRYFSSGRGGDLYYVDPWTSGALEVRELPWRDPQRLLHSASVTLQAERAEERLIPLSQADGRPFPLGLYGIDTSGHYSGNKTTESHGAFVMAVTNAAITLKAASDDTVAWVTDYITAQPLADVPVSLYVGTEMRFTGRTDEQGIAHIPQGAMAGDQTVYIVAKSEDVFGIWQSPPTGSVSTRTSYFYTDRPMYRAGETVYFRGILRDRDDLTYTLPDVKTMFVTASDWNNIYTHTTEVTVSDMGTFSGSITLPSDLMPTYSGSIYLSAISNQCEEEDTACAVDYSASTHFQVSEFRVPEFELSVTPASSVLVAGDLLNTRLKASFYHGNPVSSSDITWSFIGRGGTYFAYKGLEKGFRFQPINNAYPYYDKTSLSISDDSGGSDGSVTTDSNGEVLLDGQVEVNGFSPVYGTISASITDESYHRISAEGSVLVHPSHVYVGLRANERFNASDQPVIIDILTVTPASQLQPKQTVSLALIEELLVKSETKDGAYDQLVREDKTIKTVTIQTDAQGQALFSFLPPRPGLYRIEASAFDEHGHEARSSIYVYSLAPDGAATGFNPYSYDNPEGCEAFEWQSVQMVADRDSYRPGDEAKIVIFNPLNAPVTALLTVERQGVLMEDMIRIDGETFTYTLPITGDFAPNAYFNIAMVRAIDDNHADPAYLRGRMLLSVEPVERLLNVAITPSAETFEPGNRMTIDVMVTDWEGMPVQADVGLSVTDGAVLALRPAYTGPMIDTFYPVQWQRVNTTSAISALLATRELRGEGCGGGGGGVGGGDWAPLLRDDFVYTPLWTSIVTDETGHGSVTFTLPDNLTRWRIDARAITADADIGQAQTTVISTLPFIVRPVAPRFAVVGDHLPLSAILHNNTEEEITLSVSLAVTGFTLDDPSTKHQYVTLAPGSRQRMDWWGIVNDTDIIRMTVKGYYNNMGDAVSPAPIPVLHYTSPDYVGTSGVLDETESRIEGISLPPAVKANGLLTVQVNSSLANTALDALPALDTVNHNNMEAVASYLYASSAIYRTLKESGHLTTEQATTLAATVEQAVGLLYEGRNSYPEPSWGWWRGGYSIEMTSYVLLALYEAKQAGFAIDDAVISNGLLYMNYETSEFEENSPAARLNEQTLLFYVRLLYNPNDFEPETEYDDAADLEEFKKLFEQRAKMSDVGRAYLLMAYHEFAPDSAEAKTLISDLTSAAILNASGTHWEAEDSDWEYWGSDTRTTAVVLTALMRTAPDEPMLANAIRWLMMMRRGSSWRTTQENALSTSALMDWISLSNELNSQYDYSLTINNTGLLMGSVTADAPVTTGAYIDLSELYRDTINRFTITRSNGTGALYYTASLRLELPVEGLEAQNRGVIVERAYFKGGTREIVTTAKTGDIINVRVSVTATQNIPYFRLDDILPAGLEIINPLLETSPYNLSEMMPESDLEDIFWNAGSFSWIALQDEGATLYASYLPRGTYVYTYQVEAITPGEFQLLPASGQAVYQPDIFGRTAGGTFVITENDISSIAQP